MKRFDAIQFPWQAKTFHDSHSYICMQSLLPLYMPPCACWAETGNEWCIYWNVEVVAKKIYFLIWFLHLFSPLAVIQRLSFVGRYCKRRHMDDIIWMIYGCLLQLHIQKKKKKKNIASVWYSEYSIWCWEANIHYSRVHKKSQLAAILQDQCLHVGWSVRINRTK